MIGDKDHICKTEEEVKRAVKNKMKLIFAYGDIEISEKLYKKITDKRILILGVSRDDGEDMSVHREKNDSENDSKL